MPNPICVVIDDNPINTLLLEQALNELGCTVLAMTDPLQAEQIIIDSGITPALMIIDQQMPDIPGHRLALNLRARFGDQCQYIGWSGSPLLPAELQAFDGQLSKPYSNEQLQQLVAQLIPSSTTQLGGLNATDQAELLQLFCQCATEDLTQLATAIAQQDLPQCRRWLHKIEGSRAMLGIELPSFAQLQLAVNDGCWSSAQQALAAVVNELSNTP